MSTSPSSSSTKTPPPPSPWTILASYGVLGTLLSFAFGRPPTASLPHDVVIAEVAPVAILICVFLITYSLWDVMAMGMAKHQSGYPQKTYKDLANSSLPEQVWLAQRVQTNQLEQASEQL